MKKWISFERIMLVLILLVLFFNCYRTTEIKSMTTIEQQPQFYYFLIDSKRDKVVGIFNPSKPVQKDQIIFLDDDVYKVNFIKCFLKKDKDKENSYSENFPVYYIYSEFLGKSEEKKGINRN